jgi:hypothetical protein
MGTRLLTFVSRKLLVWVTCTVLFYTAYVLTLCLAPAAMTDWMLLAVLIMHTIVSIVYIGGNVLQKSFELARVGITNYTGGALGSGGQGTPKVTDPS